MNTEVNKSAKGNKVLCNEACIYCNKVEEIIEKGGYHPDNSAFCMDSKYNILCDKGI